MEKEKQEERTKIGRRRKERGAHTEGKEVCD